MGGEESGDLVLVLGRRDRARRVDQHAARTDSRGAGGEDRGLVSAIARTSAGVTRQRRSARACSVPRPEHGGSTSTRSNTAPSGRRAAASATSTRTLAACSRCAVRASSPARRALRSTATTSPRPPSAPPDGCSCRRARRTGRGRARPAGGRATARRASPRAIAARNAPARQAAESCASNGPSSTSASGSTGSAWVTTGSSPASVGVGEQRVDAQRHLARLVVVGHQRAGLGAQLLTPQSGDPLGMGVLDSRLRGCGIAQPGEQCGDPRARLAAAPR